MVKQKGSDINQEVFPIFIFLSLSLLLYYYNNSMGID